VTGIVAYGTYVPYWRLDGQEVAAVLGGTGRGSTRAVAAYDEDSTTMGVEAARDALAAAPEGYAPQALLFVTTSPAYLDKTNATAIHAALGLPSHVGAYDVVGAARSVEGALRTVREGRQSALVVTADVRTGLPGSADESGGGDGAACLAFGDTGMALLDTLGSASATGEFLDRWRTPGADVSHVWEERFGESAYRSLGRTAFEDALKEAAVTVGEIDHLVVAGLHGRAVRSFVRGTGVRPGAVADDPAHRIGNTGAAQLTLGVGHVLDRIEPGDVLVTVSLADGADVTVHRATANVAAVRARRRRSVAEQIEAGRGKVSYGTFLTWRGRLDREPPRRPDPAAPAAAPALRRVAWKFGLTASRCDDCGTRNLPTSRVCVACRSVDRMTAERVAEEAATVATYTVDRLAFSPSPPLIAAMIDYDGGGRTGVEIADAAPDEIEIGTRVEMTFRRLYTAANGVHNYFWKARPIREGG
jgi:3-hydroxy-3-methylglutaryl CoA synthase/uncharacterized OB-fold protein